MTQAQPVSIKQWPEGLVIRAVEPSDAVAIATLSNLPGFRAGTQRLPYHSIEDVRQWLEKSAPGSLGLVALLEDKIVGNAGLHRFTGRRAHAAPVGMGVHDDFIGRGIGAALLGELVEAADNWLAITRLELTVFTDNIPALRLYEKFGFETEGTHKAFAFRHGTYADVFAMARLRRQ
jgi:putative acetyltransferase